MNRRGTPERVLNFRHDLISFIDEKSPKYELTFQEIIDNLQMVAQTYFEKAVKSVK